MTQNVIENAKANARSLEKFMKKEGINLPYTKYLVAIANMNGYPSWEAFQGSAKAKVEAEVPQSSMAKGLETIAVTAVMHDDNHYMHAKFDASGWLAIATLEQLAELQHEEWMTCEMADRVAEFAEQQGDPDVIQLFSWLHQMNNAGFEVEIDGEKACAWLRTNRFPAYAYLTCLAEWISFSEVPGGYRYTSGDDCETVMPTLEEIAVLAYNNVIN